MKNAKNRTSLLHCEQAFNALAECGMAIYESRLKLQLQQLHTGEIVAVEPDSREYAIVEDSAAAVRALRSHNVTSLLFVRRVGPPTKADDRFPSRIAAAEAWAT